MSRRLPRLVDWPHLPPFGLPLTAVGLILFLDALNLLLLVFSQWRPPAASDPATLPATGGSGGQSSLRRGRPGSGAAGVRRCAAHATVLGRSATSTAL